MAATEDKETILLQRLNNVRKKHLSKPVRYEKVQTEFETLGRKASSFTTLLCGQQPGPHTNPLGLFTFTVFLVLYKRGLADNHGRY